MPHPARAIEDRKLRRGWLDGEIASARRLVGSRWRPRWHRVLVRGWRRTLVPYRCSDSHLRGETPTFCVKSLDIAEGLA